MTAPKPSADELRELTIQMHCDSGGCDSVRGGPPGSHESVGCHLASMLDALLAAARAEAVAPVLDVLRELVDAMPRCSNCGAVAVSLSCDGYNDHCYGCDECGGIPAMGHAPQLRTARRQPRAAAAARSRAMSQCHYTVRHEADGWIVFTRDDGTEMFRVQTPPGGFTMADVDAMRRHLLKLIEQREVGPS